MSRSPAVLLVTATCLLAAALTSFAANQAPKPPRHEDGALVPVPWALPKPGSCTPQGGLRGWPPGQDASPVPFQPGETFGINELGTLEDFLPHFIWEHRDKFFYEGMRLEIGNCFADYSPPDFFQSATAQHAGQPKLDTEGGLRDYTVGLPYPPDRIDPMDPAAGLKWAWNFELRYQAAGFWGKFRTIDMVGRDGRGEPFVGEIFRAQTMFRSDRPDKDYQAGGIRGKHWVGGGRMFEPFDARHYSWRQYRDAKHMTEPGRSDDLHAYLPDFRRVRRVSATGVEGIYMPSFSVGVVKPTVLAVSGGGGVTGGGTGAAAASSITTKRSGFEGMELRPNLYEMRLLGVQDVLTPINASNPAFPAAPDREFGPWGLSYASDRWDLRRAVVVEGRSKQRRGGQQVERFVQYFDAQSLAPLYYASWDVRDEAIDVGMYVGRWSEEREGYKRWPGEPERPIRVIDPSGASFANLQEDGGWRRESWDVIGTPPEDRILKRMLSVGNLTKRR